MPNTREKLIDLLVEFVEVDVWDNGEFIEKDIDFGRIADHLIANGVTVQKWIPVTERLPNPFTPVLVYRQSFGTLPPYIKVDKMTLWYDDTQVWTDEVGNWKNVTTHWMPLPEQPKGE